MHNNGRKSKKPIGDGGSEPESEVFKTEKILLAATQAGLTVADFEHMSIGMVFGYIIEYANAVEEAREGSDNGDEEVRQATAEDYIAF